MGLSFGSFKLAQRLHVRQIALGGVAYKPWRASKAEAALSSGASPAAAAEAELADAKGYGGNDFKIPLARRIIVSTLAQSREKSRG